MNPRMQVLWDIDRTLLSTGGAGKKAFSDAGREIFGGTFTLDDVDTLGQLDSLILRNALRAAGLGVPGPLEGRFRTAYLDRLRTELSVRSTIRLLPGVRMLHQRLTGVLAVTQGILSGNYPEIGKMKGKGIWPELCAASLLYTRTSLMSP